MKKLLLAIAVMLAAVALSPVSRAAASGWTPPAEPTLVPVRATSCPAVPAPGEATCLAKETPASDAVADQGGAQDAGRAADLVQPMTTTSKSNSYTPADLASLYRIPSTLRPTDTIGIVDVGSDPNTEAQMAYFRAFFGLPSCSTTNGCFREVAQDGSRNLPGTNSGWVVETALDVQAVSAVCPTCHILLVDAATAGVTDMARAALTATALGATYVSLSYGSGESSASTSLYNGYYNVPGVTYVAASGDSGSATGPLFPASAPSVLAAGGTSVRLVSGVWQQTAWSGSGSGCSSLIAIPLLQSLSSLTSVCSGKRAVSDLSALADPGTGMLFYRAGSWWNAGGTSLAAPILTALFALAGNHSTPLSVYSNAAAKPDDFIDVTSGSTGSCAKPLLCNAGPGWDGPTGLGTPAGLAGLTADGVSPTSYQAATTGTLSGDGHYPLRLAYRLTEDGTGTPVPGAAVLLQRARSGGYTTIDAGVTDWNGNAVFHDDPSGPTTYRVVFSTDGKHQGSTSNLLIVKRFEPKVHITRMRGAFRVALRSPWGTPVRGTSVRLQARHGSHWRSVRSAHTDRRGLATTAAARGGTYRIVYGGGSWLTGATGALRMR